MASSSKKTKLDLLVRVRYSNPVLPPSFPPQLVDIPSASDLERFTRADFVGEYAAGVPAPMLVDAEGGMPVEMNGYGGGVWVGEMGALNPSSPVPLASLHPTDRLLLDPPSIAPVSHGTTTNPTGATATARVAAGSLKQTLHKPDVTWLRNTTYLQARSGGGGAGERRRLGPAGSAGDEASASSIPDHSMAAQLQAIERSFYELEHAPELSSLKHPDPSKAHLTAVDSFEILPDEETYPTGYTWVIYPERPTDEDRAISDERLQATIMRPQRDPNSSHKTYMEMFLPEDEEAAMEDLRQAKAAPLPPAEARDGVPEDAKPSMYKYLRDFDYDGTEPQVPDGYWILSMEDGVDRTAAPAADATALIDLAAEDAEDVADLFGEDDDEPTDGAAKQSNGVNGMHGPVTTESAAAAATSGPRRPKGVYYTPVFRRTTVRKRRIGKDEMEDKTDRWDAIQVLYEEPSAEVLELRSGFDWLRDDDWANEWLRQGETNAETLGEGDGMQPGE